MRLLAMAIVMIATAIAGDADAQSLSWGAKGGTVFSALETSGSGAFDTNAKAGFTAGVFASWPWENRIAVQVETLFARRRFVTTDTVVPIAIASSSIEIPLLLNLRVAAMRHGSLHLLAGPQLSVIRGVHQTLAGATVDLSDDIDDMDAGVTAGAAIEFESMLSVEVRANFGFRNLAATLPPRLKSRAAQLLVGYRF